MNRSALTLILFALLLVPGLAMALEPGADTEPPAAEGVPGPSAPAADTEEAPARETEPAATAEVNPAPLTFEVDGFQVAASGNLCASTTSCGKPGNPYWNAFCNDFCLNAGYYGGACASNGRQSCCECIAMQSPHPVG